MFHHGAQAPPPRLCFAFGAKNREISRGSLITRRYGWMRLVWVSAANGIYTGTGCQVKWKQRKKLWNIALMWFSLPFLIHPGYAIGKDLHLQNTNLVRYIAWPKMYSQSLKNPSLAPHFMCPWETELGKIDILVVLQGYLERPLFCGACPRSHPPASTRNPLWLHSLLQLRSFGISLSVT